MHSPFGIPKKKPKRCFRRLETANNLESASVRIKELLAQSPGEYVVLDQRTHNHLVLTDQVSVSTPEESEHYAQAYLSVELARHGIARP